MKKTLVFTALIIALTSLSAAQQASIENIEPSTETVTVGQSTSVDVAYSTENVDANSCTLGVVDSSLASNWDSGSEKTVEETGSNTQTTTSPQITTASPEAETSVSLELSCTASGSEVQDTSSFSLTAANPPFLEGEIESKNSIDAEEGETYEVTFSASNTGSTKTSSATALINTPSGYSNPSSISLREAGQNDGVIRPGKSVGSNSFDLTANEGFSEGKLEIELTSSEIGTTDTLKVDLNTPSSNPDEPSDPGENGPGGGNGGGFAAFTSPNVLKNLEPGTPAEVKINKQVSTISINVSNKVKAVEINVEEQNEKPENVSSPESQVYSYMEINANTSDENIDSAEITFSVSKEWLNKTGASQSSIRMKRYKQGWNKLSTEKNGENKTHVKYAAETPGFSIFAITLEAEESGDQNNQERSNQNTSSEEEKENKQERSSKEEKEMGLITYVAAGTLLGLLALAVVFRGRIKKKLPLEDKEAKLMERLKEIQDQLRNRNIHYINKEKIISQINKGENLINEGRLEEAEEVIGEIEEDIS